MLSPYEQVVRITHIFLHNQYKDVGFFSDVSLLEVEQEVNNTDFVRPVCLPGLRFEMAECAPSLAGDSFLESVGFSSRANSAITSFTL